MTASEWSRDPERLCFGDRAAELFHGGRSPLGNLALFLHNDLFADAIRYLADLMPPRVAVWWACQCLWDVVRPHAPEEVRDALTVALQWVVEPSEEHREAARPTGPEEPLDTAWGCLRMAVVWSGGSLNEAGLPVVPPENYATPRAVAGAIMRAALISDSLQQEQRFRQFLDLGLHIADRRNLWWQPACNAGSVSNPDGAWDVAKLRGATPAGGILT